MISAVIMEKFLIMAHRSSELFLQPLAFCDSSLATAKDVFAIFPKKVTLPVKMFIMKDTVTLQVNLIFVHSKAALIYVLFPARLSFPWSLNVSNQSFVRALLVFTYWPFMTTNIFRTILLCLYI